MLSVTGAAQKSIPETLSDPVKLTVTYGVSNPVESVKAKPFSWAFWPHARRAKFASVEAGAILDREVEG